jgi:2-polyprenyl-3-methyl-5-hydroxy-6-metoxy-1,4-benzoquinol methylase
MYEEYPYPRWIDWDFPQPRTRINKLSNYFSQNELAFVNRPYNVLVAGCGTGSKAIEYAIGYGQNAKITAIDLSLTSLSYAKWKAERHNISNIEFVQMDLLDLPEIDITFDIVECTGVLHHLKDPAEGARAIIAPVKSNGIVHISLYSDLARKSIVELREKYNLVPDSTSDEIRKKRLEMMMNDADLIDNRLSLRWDFFDLHRCKDLLFHPLEHR